MVGILPEATNRIVLYEEASRSTPGSPGRFPVWLLSPIVPQRRHEVPPPGPPAAVRRALVVDDEPTIRTAVARYLRKRGWCADEAEDGWAALLTLERSDPGRYHIVISDLRMPNYSGDQLHDWLAQHRPELFEFLILTTGDLASPALRDFIARTPRPVVEKPFELAELGRLIEQVAGPSA